MNIEANQVFDFWGIISNEIIGDVWLSIFVFAIGIIYLTIRMKMPFELQLVFLILILSALYSKTLILIIWVFTVLVVGAVAYWFITKMFS